GRARRKSIAPFSEIDIENQFVTWKKLQPALIYDVSVNPKGAIYWYWSCIVSTACFYNLIFITILVFEDIRDGFYSQWITGNLICDAIYIIDMWMQSRIFFYENGCKVAEIAETRNNYFSSTHFMLDILSILPSDLILFIQYDASLVSQQRSSSSFGFSAHIFIKDAVSLSSCLCLYVEKRRWLSSKAIKTHKVDVHAKKTQKYSQAKMLQIESLAKVFVSLMKIVVSCTLIFHWNACAFYIISTFRDTTSWDG
ncbi:hypothetical protein NECAME_06211, partial [Necator americanus]